MSEKTILEALKTARAHLLDSNELLFNIDGDGYMQAQNQIFDNNRVIAVIHALYAANAEPSYPIELSEAMTALDVLEQNIDSSIYNGVDIIRAALEACVKQTQTTGPDFSKFATMDYIHESSAQQGGPQALPATTHDSDCSTHNEPAYPAGECDCSASPAPVGGIADERAHFESFVKSHGDGQDRWEVNWTSYSVQMSWDAWMARASLSLPKPDAVSVPDDALANGGGGCGGNGAGGIPEGGGSTQAKGDAA